MGQLITKVRTDVGDIQIDYNGLANLPKSDPTLKQEGNFADAKATGDAINKAVEDLTGQMDALTYEDVGALPDTYIPPVTSVGGKTGDITFGDGIDVSGEVITNSGVRSVSTGTENGTISVNTNGSSVDVPVQGLGSAAYTESDDYAPAVHTHSSLYMATLLASNWSEEAPYTQNVDIDGILASDNPFVDLNMEDVTVDNIEDYQDAWQCVSRILAEDGFITAYCYTDMPEVDMKIIMKVVR